MEFALTVFAVPELEVIENEVVEEVKLSVSLIEVDVSAAEDDDPVQDVEVTVQNVPDSAFRTRPNAV